MQRVEFLTAVDESETEVTKHEENLLKIFATASDSRSQAGASTLLLCGPSIVMLGFAIGIVRVFPTLVTALKLNAPHLDDVLGANAYMLSMFIRLDDIAAANANAYGGLFAENTGLGNVTIWEGLDMIRERVTLYGRYFHRSRYGDPASGERPFEGYLQQITKAKEIVVCKDTN
jgi:hypothetical protein